MKTGRPVDPTYHASVVSANTSRTIVVKTNCVPLHKTMRVAAFTDKQIKFVPCKPNHPDSRKVFAGIRISMGGASRGHKVGTKYKTKRVGETIVFNVV